MFIHQTLNSVGKEVFNAYLYKNVLYAPHLHKGYEFVYVLEGELCAIIDGTARTARAGEGFFLFPYQIHSYEKGAQSVTLITVFSENYIHAFTSLVTLKKPLSPLFTPTKATKDFLLSVFPAAPDQNGDVASLPTPDPLELKAVLYAICADFFQQSEFIPNDNAESSLILRCLLYIEENYTADISLKDMANTLGYNQEYLSRIFNRTLGVSFKAMLHQYRCEKAQQLLIESKENIATIAMECGFQSICTFNRVFKEITGIPPSCFREGK